MQPDFKGTESATRIRRKGAEQRRFRVASSSFASLRGSMDALFLSLPVFFAQFLLENFSRAAFGQRVEKLD